MVNWAVPGSLAATDGISVDFLSSGYLDVSVPRVRFHALWIQTWMTCRSRPGFPIRTPPDQSSFASSPRTIAGYDVLHRLLPPRHPPFALTRLTTQPQAVSPPSAARPASVLVRMRHTPLDETGLPAPPGAPDRLSELSRIEPRPPQPRTTRESCGARRVRTADLLLAKQALSRLSYGPITSAPWKAGSPFPSSGPVRGGSGRT